ncbi:MAG: SAM-dependent methyltransferase [Actinomycetes bacterium]
MTWQAAMQSALYGPHGFFTAGEGPSAHFRTSAHTGPLFATAVLSLLRRVDDALGRPPRLDLVDVGAGRGELLTHIATQLDLTSDDELLDRLHIVAVELAPRPDASHPSISWTDVVPDRVVGLVLANEWLDNVPLDVVEVTTSGARTIEVDPTTGDEAPAGPVDDEDLRWLQHWWPPESAHVGDRLECGATRDRAWADVVAHVDRGVAVAIDYGHLRAQRQSRAFAGGTLTAYRAGRMVAAVPDGSCDITAHVAMDSCGQAGRSAGATATLLMTQREALEALGVSGGRPPLSRASSAPAEYLAALANAGVAAELRDPAGLGAFLWLVQGRRIEISDVLPAAGGAGSAASRLDRRMSDTATSAAATVRATSSPSAIAPNATAPATPKPA